MSLRSLLNRRVAVLPMNVVSVDRYNNETRGPGAPIPDVRARRDQIAVAEDLRDRDQQSKTFRYLLALRSEAGLAVVVTGRDRIQDGTETFEVVGSPETLYRRRRPHHLEATAVLVEG